MWLREVFGVFYLTAVFATTDAQNDLPKPVLKVTQGWADAFENEIMEFLCEVDTEIPDVTFTWYKDKEELQADTDIYSDEPYLNITSVERVHEGGYTCQIQVETKNAKSEFSNMVSVTVYENVPKATLKRDPDLNPMFVGETVNFTCNVGVATGWKYQWHKDGMALNETNKTYSMDLQPSAAGRYSCLASRGSTTSTEMSGEIKQDVANIPVPSLRNLVPWQDVFPGERVQMSCHMNDSSDWTYTWYKDGQEVHADLGVSFDSNKATLFISSAAATSRGEYKCTGHLINRSVSTGSSSGFNLEVYDEMPKVTLTQDPDYKVIFPGESVVFSCHINNSYGWEYIWLKDMNSLPHTDKRLSISPRDSSDQGSYECQAKRGTGHPFYTDKSRTVNIKVEENKPQPLMTQQPDVEKVYIGEPVSFKCEIKDSAGWEYVWFKDGKALPLNTTILDIPHASLSDSGTYECKGIRNKTKYNSKNSHRRQVLISGIPNPEVKKRMPWSDVFPTENVILSCEMNSSSDWTYTWYKDGQEVHADLGVSFDSNKATLFISSAAATSRGEYKCTGHLINRSVSTGSSSGFNLEVYDEMPKVTLTQDPDYKVIFPGESVVFSCHINNSYGWEYIWLKDMNSLPHTDKRLSISPRDSSDQGSYECQAKRGTGHPFYTDKSRTVNIKVEENKPQPLMTQQPDVEKVYIGEPVSFKCEIKDSAGWEYVWFKDGKALPLNTTILDIPHASVSDSGTYECKGIRNKTKYNSKNSHRRQVLISGIPNPEVKKRMPWSDVFPTENVILSCEMNSSSDWTYTWYKDGQEVHTGLGVSFDSNKATLFISSAAATSRGEYKCTGHLINRSVSTGSSSGFNLEVYDEMPKVTLTQDPDYKVIFPGESVVFSCHINNSYGWEYIWLKDMNSLPHTDKRLSISPRDSSDQGSYECQAKRGTDHPFYTDKSRTVNIKVEENKPQPLMTQQPDVEKVYIGEPVSFKCEIKDSAGWEYVWFKDGKALPLNTTVLDIPHASVSDSGTYECKGIRNKTKYNSKNSHRRQVLISEIPSPKVENITQWLHVFPTESLRLSCEMDGSSDWMFSWHKDGQEVHAGQDVSFDKDATVLSINSASASHRGRYSCSGKHKQRTVSSNVSSGIQLDVYDTKPRVQLSQSPEHTLMHTEDSVTFLCHINISTGWEFLWFKDDRPLTVPGNNLTLSSMSVKNTGLYKCQTRRGTSLIFSSDPSPTIYLTVEERPKAEVILLTGWSQVFSTDSLQLSCRLQNSQERWNYTWYRDGRKLENPPSPTYRVTPQDDPEQSQYSCQGIRNGTLSYSRISDRFWTKNLLLKRRLLLSIAGCIVFGICIICIGCIVLRMCRKKAQEDYKPEEADLFLRMDALKDSDDGPPLLVQYVTESALNSLSKEEGENGTVISESPLPPVQEEPATTTESPEAMQNNNSGLISFMQ